IDRFGNPGNHSVPIHQAFGGFARGHGSEGLITMLDIIKALLPSICVALLFWYVIRNIFRADRNEREQVDKYYSEIDVSEVENNSESDVKMTSTKSSDYEKSEHGKGNAPRSHRGVRRNRSVRNRSLQPGPGNLRTRALGRECREAPRDLRPTHRQSASRSQYRRPRPPQRFVRSQAGHREDPRMGPEQRLPARRPRSYPARNRRSL